MKNLQDKLDWEILQKPIYNANGVRINGYKEITKNNSNSSSLISVMKDSYYPIPVGEFTDIVERISTETGMEIAGYNEFKKGAIITAQLKSTNDFIIGDSVKVIDGPFNDFDGNVQEVSKENRELSM
jgi:transcription antitermination factor NusG